MSVTAKAMNLVDIRDMDRTEWLAARRKGIGGSDAAAILGLSPWTSPLAVWMDKTGRLPLEDNESEAMHWGKVLEEPIAEEFATRTGFKLRRRNFILANPEHPIMLANLDREIVGIREGVEIKTAHAFTRGEWAEGTVYGDERDTGKVPDQYVIQCQHYMAVTGYKRWHIAVLIGGNEFLHIPIERNDDLIAHLIAAEESFWNKYVVPDLMPPADASESSANALKTLFAKSKPDSEIILDIEATKLIEDYATADETIKKAEKDKAAAGNLLKQMLGENEIGIIAGNPLVKWGRAKTTRFDMQRFKAEHPDIYAEYARQEEQRTLKVTLGGSAYAR